MDNISCRLCLSALQKGFKNIQEDCQLSLKIEDCVSVKVIMTDNFSKMICNICIEKVDNWYEFRQMCLNSQKFLKNTLTNCQQENNIAHLDDVDDWQEEMQNKDVPSDFEDYYDESKVDLDEMIMDVKFEYLPFVYKCDICGTEFDICLDYLEHQDEHEGKPLFKCEKCKEVFSSKTDLAYHEKCHKVACKICGKLILRLSMKLHLISHTDRYKCSFCSHRFNSNSTLEQHIITVHTDQKNHICDLCGKRFSSKTSLTTHSKIHKEKRDYKCKLCDYAGHTASAIYTHMSKHMNEKHSCEMCGKIFKSYRNLYDHLKRVHTREKKHECPHCGIKFSQKYMLVVHLRTHTGVRPYKCKRCDKTFVRSDSLKEHMVTHEPRTTHVCTVCSKKFMTKRGKERHSCTFVSVEPLDDS